MSSLLEKDFSKLEKKLSVKFKNKDLLVQALVHRSYLNEHPEFHLGHNERLEFLGDAVLELVITEHLYNNFPNPEGELTNWRAALVNARILSVIAESLGLNEYLYLSKGESKDMGKARQYILANTIEAVIGAIYLDRGTKITAKFIHKFITVHLTEILEKKLYMDPKSKFQEISQERLGLTPTYRVLEEAGPDHAKVFKVGIYLGEDLIGEGAGSSKQEAQIEAAEAAIKNKGW
ncbi:MAG: Ribonuclease 3 [Parcubacteria group bacterium Gr01-1014_18]|nr:MAG: Ribonuclease 3 [Parcubacteria group bacterium Greene0416_36]TSC81011.1 MAG: Ribonuclease 3 [Parcubacteria group bacterium Gr01-1014_18]TSC98933.1 MAG: Ribonuclease 3 [Parcubacteria group bacterium Greene1014_20]TSD06775.1 MAG: Ribonuclease 3 [Parcubacteria group bacterium Greene0714_2]